MFKKSIRNIKTKIKNKFYEKSEFSARRAMMNELFNDLNTNRRQVYSMNFFRGIFFGLGTVIGGTVVVALLIWTLNMFVDWFPYIGEYLKLLIEAMRAAK